MSKSLKEKLVFPAVSVAIGLVVVMLFLEIVLRFLPVSEGHNRQPVTEENPILRFTPDRTFQWSLGWDFTLTNKVRVNADGFISSIEYDKDDPSRLLAVVGDSYVEAIMTPYEKTGAGLLMNELEGEARVYSFAIMGSPLSQYLAIAEYVRDTYRPDAMVVVIIGNDFDESFLVYKTVPGYHYFVENDDGSVDLQRIDYAPGKLNKPMRHSALARYLLLNIKAHTLPSRLKARFSRRDPTLEFVGNTRSDARPERVARSKRGIDEFLRQLPQRSGLDPSRILLVVDGMRPHLYDTDLLESSTGSYFAQMRRHMLERAVDAGYEIVDLQPVFMDHFAEHGDRFEYERDVHWNDLGNEMFFEVMNRSAVVERLRSVE